MSFCYFYQVTARGTLKNYRIFTVLLNFPTKVRSPAEKTVCGIKWARRSYSASSDAAGTGTRKCISFSCLTGNLMLPPTRWATQYGQESKSGLKVQCLPAQHKQLKYFQKDLWTPSFSKWALTNHRVPTALPSRAGHGIGRYLVSGRICYDF